MSALTDRLYAEWRLRNGGGQAGCAAAPSVLRRQSSEELREQFMRDAREAAERWRSARQRPAVAGNSSGIASSSSPSIEVQASGQS